MRSFLEEVVAEIVSKKQINDDLVLIVPSKRAAVFLLQEFARKTTKAIFAPTILTIEEFIKELAGLQYSSNTQLLFELYATYQKKEGEQAESFYSFSKWAQTLLQDFNEIDRYLIPAHDIFSYLSAIQETNHWYLKPDKTPMMEAYIRFWNSLEPLYNAFRAHLATKGIGYQGMVYRKAFENIEAYLKSNVEKWHAFIGFNALNTAESEIIKMLLSEERAEVYWDIDNRFLEDPMHDAGYFIRAYKKQWPYLKLNPLKGPTDLYKSEKKIKIIGVPKNVAQANYVGNLLASIQEVNKAQLNKTAVILGNESLLNPVLNALPPSISSVNVTMGYPLKNTAAANLFNEYIALAVHQGNSGWYHKDLISFLTHPYIQCLFKTPEETTAALIKNFSDNNRMYVGSRDLLKLTNTDKEALELLFSEPLNTPAYILEACLNLLQALRTYFSNQSDFLSLEYLVQFEVVFNEIKEYMTTYDFITDVKSFQGLYKEVIANQNIDFYGEPLSGVQIMGMLESRNLDFETVILTSVNEGILPSGKSNTSLIPFDLKKEYNLPTYKEKDAVYTYHFYRLLQRAKNVYILYNTETDVLEGGERSRFISQLLTDELHKAELKHIIATPSLNLEVPASITIDKDFALLQELESRAKKGFSPSSLSTYIKNPIEFYRKYILHIKDPLEVEETIAANTFGTIIHASMETLYTPFIGTVLSPEKLKSLFPQIKKVVIDSFKEHYPNVSLKSGKNLIAFEVIQKYIQKFLKQEIKESAAHRIEIIALEESFLTPVSIPGLTFPIALKGNIDRIDKKDGALRILDYKTGATKRTEVEITSWESLISDPNKSKAFQLLCYTYMYNAKNPTVLMTAAIIPFKNINDGIFPFGIKEAERKSAKDQDITAVTLQLFQEQLKNLILQICDPNNAFAVLEGE